MALNIPTTQALKDSFLSLMEAAIGQTAPTAAKAFLRVMAATVGALFTSLYKFAAQETKENLAISASRAGLIKIGNEYDLPIKPAAATVLTATIGAVDPNFIPQTVDFVGDANGIRYYLSGNSDPSSGGSITLTLTARVTGAEGNLSISDTLTIGSPVAGVNSTATVISIATTGADAEATEDYRARLLTIIRSPGGGGNSADYRNWSNEVVGVQNSYPYAGLPGGGGSPPDRTVYVEATSDIDPDGIAPTSLLNQVRASITTDPVTGITRQPLGLTDATLYIESITRTSFFVEVRGLTIDATKEAQTKADILTAVTAYFLSVHPFIDGLDPDFEKMDTITDSSITNVIYGVVDGAGGYFTGVGFGTSLGVFLASYVLGQGEHAKIASVTYA